MGQMARIRAQQGGKPVVDLYHRGQETKLLTSSASSSGAGLDGHEESDNGLPRASGGNDAEPVTL